jgi:hypothetical protein
MSFVDRHVNRVAYVDTNGNRRRPTISRGAGGGNDLDEYVKKKQAARDRAAAIKAERENKALEYANKEQNRLAHDRAERVKSRGGERAGELSHGGDQGISQSTISRLSSAPDFEPPKDDDFSSRLRMHRSVASRGNEEVGYTYGQGEMEGRRRRGVRDTPSSRDDYERRRYDERDLENGHGRDQAHAEMRAHRSRNMGRPQSREARGGPLPPGPGRAALLERIKQLEGELQNLDRENRDLLNRQSGIQMAIDELDEESKFPSFQF